jgi:hypothetical protein
MLVSIALNEITSIALLSGPNLGRGSAGGRPGPPPNIRGALPMLLHSIVFNQLTIGRRLEAHVLLGLDVAIAEYACNRKK